jgi:hypothetical protein
MFSVILYMLRQTLGRRAPLLPFPSLFPSYCDVSEARSYFASIVGDQKIRGVEGEEACAVKTIFPSGSTLQFVV